MTKMNYTIVRFDAENFDLEKAIRKEEDTLQELVDQLDILNLSGKEGNALVALEARISSIKKSIASKRSQIIQNETERNGLRAKLEE